MVLATFACGIGLNTAVFSLYSAAVLRSLPVRDPDRVLNVYQKLGGEYAREVQGSAYLLSYPEFQRYRAGAPSLQGLAAYDDATFLEGASQPVPVPGMFVTCDYFAVLDVRIAIGRPPSPDECAAPGSGAVAVLGDAYWRRRFGGRAAVIGTTLRLNDHPVTVIGVAEQGFNGTELVGADMWVPLTMRPLLDSRRDLLSNENISWLTAIGRLANRASIEQVQAELAVSARIADRAFPGRITTAMAVRGAFLNTPEERAASAAVGVGVGLTAAIVLLMACANAMNLLLARSTSRQREASIRLAVGASRSQILTHLMSEIVVLALAGGVLGLGLAWWLPPLVLAALPGSTVNLEVTPNAGVLALAIAGSLMTALASGLVPARRAANVDVTATLRGGGEPGGARGRTSRLRRGIVAIQVAGSVLLLVVAGLFQRGVQHARATDPGFVTKGVMTLSVSVPPSRGKASTRQFYERLAGRLAVLPGVRSVAWSAWIPLLGRWTASVTGADGTAVGPQADRALVAGVNAVSTDYFDAMDVRILRGRAFTEADVQQIGAPAVKPAVISAAMAERLWPGRDPIGLHFESDGKRQVVGVAEDVRNADLSRIDGPFFYVPVDPEHYDGVRLILRVSPAAAGPLSATIQRIGFEIDEGVLVEARRYEDELADALRPLRLGATLMGAFGALAALLAVIGAYGVISYVVSVRRRELGVRMAIGASPREVQRLVMQSGARPVAVGLSVGVLLATWAAYLLRALLFGLSPLDPVALLGATGLVAAAAGVTLYLPARRASRAPTTTLLREDG
ncbi:MAG: hypothetical protein MNPFHGCM_03269 [Gemmatimonadaceae bacterium]|nr:hypothetical protein [Gemmatimonadaceae bacterium]